MVSRVVITIFFPVTCITCRPFSLVSNHDWPPGPASDQQRDKGCIELSFQHSPCVSRQKTVRMVTMEVWKLGESFKTRLLRQ
ncbi:uncharacterized protein BDZ99DRAFT_73051 [Mytilinidion resinicola]|uniref:Secreted protein n=1 Tax=Mytilinidion resinicola TaxID=574789 RepID=A0A6A6YH68_9PEZI|nr:uncharacterized protein BDZ99DRAFT_73051 [Mytilinidion resinicola]KAF2808100.1 hypothetical protein BDZ99DRAFT_73051 [Mytilinidion resinicola]